MPTVYLDSSILIAFLYEEENHPHRFEETQRLFSAMPEGVLSGVVSFYALPELYGYVKQDQPEQAVNTVFRLSLVELFSVPLIVMPFLDRDDFDRLRQQFTIADPEDVRHVAAALFKKCDAIITFDHHFEQVANVIPVYTPDEFLATLESSDAN